MLSEYFAEFCAYSRPISGFCNDVRLLFFLDFVANHMLEWKHCVILSVFVLLGFCGTVVLDD